ncbi:MAG: phosphoglycerate dehydrogenase [Anaerolineaceae bacterium]|nr:phosphoglycerate dehydrogenase [Anaerolineaceae bacterium]
MNLKDYRVLVTATSYAMDDPTLRTDLEAKVGEVIYNTTAHPLTAGELVELIAGIDGMIAGLDIIDSQVIQAADRLKVIARYGVGLDRVDLEAARDKGIIVTNTPGANATSVAELTVGLMIALTRNIIEADRRTRAGEWPRMKGTTLTGKTIGLLGLGAIGHRVARLLSGFDCHLIGYDPFILAEEAAQFGVEWAERDAVIRRADILSLHFPPDPSTENLLNHEMIASMKDGAYLINTARSELVDEAALIDALRTGKIAGVALDTFHQEPPGADHPIFQFSQVVATPHTGAHTDDATRAMGRIALEDCLAVLRGEEPLHRIV